jgi:hypothetical protein
MGTNHEDGMIEIIYRDGRVERLGSAYGLVSDGVELHMGLDLGPVRRRFLSEIEEVRFVGD